MILIVIAIWLGILHLLVKKGVLKGWNPLMKASPFLIWLTFFLVVAIPMNFTAPKGSVMTLRETVPVAPVVAGQVTDVLVHSNTPVAKGQTLFKVNSLPYQAKVDALEAQIRLTETRLAQAQELLKRQSGRVADVEQFQAQLDQLNANLSAAQFDLANTEIKSPRAGFIPYVGLEEGAVLPAMTPVMSVVDSENYALGVVIAQNYLRHVELDQTADVVLKLFPGQTFKAKVSRIVQQAKGGQIKTSGVELDIASLSEQPFMVVLEMELDTLPKPQRDKLLQLPAGAFGTAVVYTQDMSSIGELIQAIMLRTETWINFL